MYAEIMCEKNNKNNIFIEYSIASRNQKLLEKASPIKHVWGPRKIYYTENKWDQLTLPV